MISFILKKIKEQEECIDICSIYQSIEISFSIFESQENNLYWYKEKIKFECWNLKAFTSISCNKYNKTTIKLLVAS